MLPDKPASQSWVVRGLAVALAAKAALATGLVVGSPEQVETCLGLIDWARLADLAQWAGLGGVAYGFRGVLGRIHLALQKPAI